MDKYELISHLFSPQVVTFIVFTFVVIFLHLNLSYLIIITLFYSVIPFIILFVLLKLGRVSDLYVTKREERSLPIVLAILFYVLGLFLVTDSFLFRILLLYIINTIIILIVSFKFKISIHVSTTVSGISLIVYILGYMYLPLYLFGLLISYVRYRMGVHTISQVVVAWLFAPISYSELYIIFHTLFYVWA